MLEEWKNKFDRAQKSTLADDQKTRFDRFDELRSKKRVASDTQDERTKRRVEQRASWVGDGRSDLRTASGVKLTEDLRKLKEASDASRVAPPQITAQPSDEDLCAFTRYFAEVEPQYFPDETNGRNLWNAMHDAVAQGKLTWGIPGLRTMFRWLLDNGYISEIVKQGTRGAAHASRPAQRTYPTFVSAEERQRHQHNMAVAEQILDAEDARRAKAVPFSELQRQVREDNPHYGTRQEPI